MLRTITICAFLAFLPGGWTGCASVSPEKREQVQRAQESGVYSYQRIQRMNNAQAVSRSR